MTQTALGQISHSAARKRYQRKPGQIRDRLAERAQTQNLTTEEAAKLSGASLRQLQWWDEQGLVQVRHDGHKRIYMPEDTRKVIVIAQLRTRGLSLQQCRRLMRHGTGTVQGIVDALDVLKRFNLRVS